VYVSEDVVVVAVVVHEAFEVGMRRIFLSSMNTMFLGSPPFDVSL